jgi:hypothetical protein
MYMLFEQALVSRSSNFILFFKKSYKEKERGEWKEYYRIEKMRGQIYFIRGNVRIQITTEDKIYFYMIHQETLMPSLDNVMFNFMKCTSLMIGSRVKYAIAFKIQEPVIRIYTRRVFHNFKVVTDTSNQEGAVCCELSNTNSYAFAIEQQLTIRSSVDFTDTESLEVNANRDDVKILFMTVSIDQKKLGIVLGKELVRKKVEITELIIYSIDRRGRW